MTASTTKKTAGQILLASSRASVKVSGEVWGNTGLLVGTLQEQLVGAYNDPTTEGKKKAGSLRNIVMDVWTKEVDKDVPAKGINGKGEEIVLRHDGSKKSQTEGQIKFRAWDQTARTAQGIATICSAIVASDFDTIFPEGVLISKTRCEEIARDGAPSESAYKAIKRALTLIASKTTELSDIAEISELDGLFSKTMTDYNVHCHAVKLKAAPAAASA